MITPTLRFQSAGLLGLLRRRRPALARCAPMSRPPVTALVAPELRKLSARRAEAMRALFPKLSAWQARREDLAAMHAAAHHLAQAADLADLEARLRELERTARAVRGH